MEFDNESINNFTIELEPRNLPNVTFACQGFYDKGGRFLTRNSTRLPGVPMVDVLFSLAFAPQVEIKADEGQTYYQTMICDGGEMVIELTHILTH